MKEAQHRSRAQSSLMRSVHVTNDYHLFAFRESLWVNFTAIWAALANTLLILVIDETEKSQSTYMCKANFTIRMSDAYVLVLRRSTL